MKACSGEALGHTAEAVFVFPTFLLCCIVCSRVSSFSEAGLDCSEAMG